MEKMISWEATKLFFKKLWTWTKHYWYIPVMVIIAIVSWCFGRRNSAGILEMFEASKQSYKKEIEVLNQSHADEIEKRNNLIVEYQATLKKLEKEYKIKSKELSKREKEEVKKIVEKFENDPDGLARRIAEEFGIEHVQ